MQLQHIELEKLKETAVNMRHAKKAPDVSDILPSVKARGILVPLLVRPNGGDDTYEIVAGRRRYFAAKQVEAEAGSIEPLPCAIMEAGDDAAALEASMLENFARLDPDEMTQYETFVRLTKEGKTVDAIAQTFGITELMVKRRLALGNLMPKIRDAYRNEEIDGRNHPPSDHGEQIPATRLAETVLRSGATRPARLPIEAMAVRRSADSGGCRPVPA